MQEDQGNKENEGGCWQGCTGLVEMTRRQREAALSQALIKDQIRLSATHVMPPQADVASHTK